MYNSPISFPTTGASSSPRITSPTWLHGFPDDGVAHCCWDINEFNLKIPAFLGQSDNHLTGIFLAFRTRDDAFLFHALDERCHRIGLQVEAFGDVVHRLGVLLPQHQQHQVLRVSQSVLRKQRMIGLCEKARSGVEPETAPVLFKMLDDVIAKLAR